MTLPSGGGGGGSGDVTAASGFSNDNRIIRSNGTSKGVQASAWTLLDTGEASVTVDGEDEIGLAIISTGVNGTAISGTNTTNAGVGVNGATSVSGGVGVDAVSTHADGIPLRVIKNGGFAVSITSAATAARSQILPDSSGTFATQEWVTANVTGAVATDAIWDAAGDTVYGTGANTAARLAIGTAGQLYHVNAGATAPEWTSSPSVTTITATTVNASAVRPATDDGAALGATTHRFSDLFLASGAVINFASGNVALTHGSGLVTVTAGELRITTAGTNTASVPTLGSTSTFTNKTLTAPVLGGAVTMSESAYILLDSVLSADGVFTGTAIPGTAGATLAFGNAVYLDPTDSRWELTDANAAAGADGDCRGLVGVCILAAAADGDPTRILVHGTVRADAAFPTFTVGAPVYFSETAGALTSTAPVTTDSVSRVAGWAVDGNSILVSPAGSWSTHT
jgi:hypothetical protein